MARSYELALVFDPRLSEDEANEITAKFKEIIASQGATVTKEENWGKRKLAYPIRKFNEGRYLFLYVAAPDSMTWQEIERLILQNERILRHLVVRTTRISSVPSARAKRSPASSSAMPWRVSATTIATMTRRWTNETPQP
ncbi:MAG: 30S ribosomal protein S6 [Thermoanaerobaculia bacterium]|nr:30S ribosomal protein S6 [Thermoanaerobaculia bacterium]